MSPPVTEGIPGRSQCPGGRGSRRATSQYPGGLSLRNCLFPPPISDTLPPWCYDHPHHQREIRPWQNREQPSRIRQDKSTAEVNFGPIGIGTSGTGLAQTIVYVHGIGNKPTSDILKCQWDQALFEFDLGEPAGWPIGSTVNVSRSLARHLQVGRLDDGRRDAAGCRSHAQLVGTANGRATQQAG